MAAEQVSYAPPEGGYPIQLGVTTDREVNRVWGIPLLGMGVRAFLSIPHMVVVEILNFCLGIWWLLGWIYILAYGRVPALVVSLATESMQRQARVGGYVLLMPGGYPPLEPGPSKPINVQVSLDNLEINRLWGIPVVNWLVRILVLIPHLIVISILGTIAGLSILILWIPILVNGRYPDWAASFYGMLIRYATRLGAYIIFLPVPYPPIMPS
jgi:hypothetical protein